MSLRFRRSIKICKGLKVNFGKTGASLTVGSGPVKRTIHTSGNVTTTVGLPGTGLYWTETEQPNSQRRNSHRTPRNYQQPNSVNELVYQIDPDVESYFARSSNIQGEDYSPESADSSISEYVTERKWDNNAPHLSEQDIKSIYAFSDEPVEWTELIAGTPAEELLMDSDKYNVCRKAAHKILVGDIDAYLDIIEKLRPVDDLLLYGGDFEFGTDKANYVEVEFSAMPENALNGNATDELLEEFLCAVSIRVARDLMALLPISKVLLHVTMQDMTVLSVLFTRGIMMSLNFRALNAKSVIQKFEHRCTISYTLPQTIERLQIT